MDVVEPTKEFACFIFSVERMSQIAKMIESEEINYRIATMDLMPIMIQQVYDLSETYNNFLKDNTNV